MVSYFDYIESRVFYYAPRVANATGISLGDIAAEPFHDSRNDVQFKVGGRTVYVNQNSEGAAGNKSLMDYLNNSRPGKALDIRRDIDRGIVHELAHLTHFSMGLCPDGAFDLSEVHFVIGEGFAHYLSLNSLTGIYQLKMDGILLFNRWRLTEFYDAKAEVAALLKDAANPFVRHRVGYNFFSAVAAKAGPAIAYEIIRHPDVTFEEILHPGAYLERVVLNASPLQANVGNEST